MATDHTRNKLIDTDDAKWRGYSIDELKYRRAVALVKLEMQKTMLAGSVKSVTNSISDTKARLLGATGKRFEGKLKFVNYLVVGYKSMRMAMNLWNTFKSKKKR